MLKRFDQLYKLQRKNLIIPLPEHRFSQGTNSCANVLVACSVDVDVRRWRMKEANERRVDHAGKSRWMTSNTLLIVLVRAFSPWTMRHGNRDESLRVSDQSPNADRSCVRRYKTAHVYDARGSVFCISAFIPWIYRAARSSREPTWLATYWTWPYRSTRPVSFGPFSSSFAYYKRNASNFMDICFIILVVDILIPWWFANGFGHFNFML